MKVFQVFYKFVYRKVHVNEYIFVEATDKQQAFSIVEWAFKNESGITSYRIKKIV